MDQIMFYWLVYRSRYSKMFSSTDYVRRNKSPVHFYSYLRFQMSFFYFESLYLTAFHLSKGIDQTLSKMKV